MREANVDMLTMIRVQKLGIVEKTMDGATERNKTNVVSASHLFSFLRSRMEYGLTKL